MATESSSTATGTDSSLAEQSKKKAKVSDEEEKEAVVVAADSAAEDEMWDIVCVVPKGEDKPCMTEKCLGKAVASWASNVNPDELWHSCEKCQEADFGGWPVGFHRGDTETPKDSCDPLPAVENAQDGKELSNVIDSSVDAREDASSGVVEYTGVPKPGADSDEPRDEPMTFAPDSSEPTDAAISATTIDSDSSTADDDSKSGQDEPAKLIDEECMSPPQAASGDGTNTQATDEAPQVLKPDEKGEAEEEEEMWDLKRILGLPSIAKECPIKCSTAECPLAACSVWASSLAPTEKWYSCIDCQEKDFDGWPSMADLPITSMTSEHKQVMAEKCSSQKAPPLPHLPAVDGASPTREASDRASSHMITPPPPSALSKTMQAKHKDSNSTVTPSPVVANGGRPAAPQQSKKMLDVHRKWQQQAEAMGGPDARIVVSKPTAKKLIFDVLHDAFCPMNITELHKKLKAVVPSPVLRSCVDEMALDKAEDENPFADSDSEDEDGKKTKKETKKETPSSNVPYAGSLSFKAGRNSNTCLYYVDYSKLKNNGNGLEPDERNSLAADMAQAEAEEAKLEDDLQRTLVETAKLLSEPTNEEADDSLKMQEAKAEANQEMLEAARKLKVNEKHKLQTKKRIDSLVTQWRKRKRLCLDFLIMMEECTDGAISMKKCLAGDGQIEIDSDEAVCQGAIAFHKRKRAKTGAKKGVKKLVSNKNTNTDTSDGISPTESFVGVKLDAKGNVCRVYADGGEDERVDQTKPKARVSV